MFFGPSPLTLHSVYPQQAEGRVFLLLQGPHGPFFDQLGELLRDAGAVVWRVGFNAGDEYFWSDKDRFIPFTDATENWPAHLEEIVRNKRVTDIILYGDVRPVHAAARRAAFTFGLQLHVFEEGYLRPYWISYERGGSNGNSALMHISIAEMRSLLSDASDELRRPPSHWGDMRHHKFYGAFYHLMILLANRRYRGFRSHRSISVWQEFRLHFRRFVSTPLHAVQRRLAERCIQRGGWPFILVLMQLEHDASFRAHSSFSTMREFTDKCLREFARHAPRHHRLIFKAHPLEDDRAPSIAAIEETAQKLGIADRVHYVRGGPLASLLAQARAVITVNSTSAQQALWRGLPVKALGRAVYSKAELVSEQTLGDFIVDPHPPDRKAYRDFRNYLLLTSQVPGGFYAQRSRSHALRLVCDLILSPDDPYESLAQGRGSFRQQLADHKD